MAAISGSTSDRISSIRTFLGLNEAPEGDTKLRLGEAAQCVNWKVTRDGNLQRRHGLKTIFTLSTTRVKGLWVGYVAGVMRMLAACDGKLYQLYDGQFGQTEIGNIDCTNDIHFFGFSGKVYILNGLTYKEWDGTTYKDVEGYVPIVVNALGPDDTTQAGGELLEGVNKLSRSRKVWLSPDGTHTVFSLPEQNLYSIDYIKKLSDGSTVPTTDYSVSLATGKITFSTALAEGQNSYEVKYTLPSSASYYFQVANMRYSELYSGSSDNRVVLYGDGTNEIFYSGIDYDGNPRADYFPDLNVISVGDSNTPITSVIRHYSRLIVFKTDSTWSMSYSTTTLSDGSIVPAFYATSINRNLGNEPLGQVCLVLNSPRSLYGKDIFEWRSNSSYNSNLTADERQAKRISDRVYASLGTFSLRNCKCFDDNDNQEYYIVYGSEALVHNYAADAWYVYTNFNANVMCSLNRELYIGTTDGKIKRLDSVSLDDDGTAINAHWESGSISYGSEWMRKYSAMLWVSTKPQSSSYLEVTISTDKKEEGNVKTILTGSGGFADLDFASFSFADNPIPSVKKIKLKAKKFTYYKLKFQTAKAGSTATVLGANIKTRETGNVK